MVSENWYWRSYGKKKRMLEALEDVIGMALVTVDGEVLNPLHG